MWCNAGAFEHIRNTIFEILVEDGIGRTKCGKGSKIMTTVNEDSRREETLGDLLDIIRLQKMVGDRAYDSDSHDKKSQKSYSSL